MSMQKLSTVVRFQAEVGNTFATATRAVRGDLSGVARAYGDLRERQAKLNQYDPAGVRRMGREYRDLKRDADKLARAFEATEKPGKDMRRERLATPRAADKAGKAYDAARKRLKSLEGELQEAGVDTGNFRREQRRLADEVDRSRRKLEGFQKLSGAGKRVGGAFASAAMEVGKLTAGLGLAAGGIFALADSTASLGDATAKTADKLGIAIGPLQELRYAAERSGVSTANFDTALEQFVKRTGEAAQGAGAAKGAMESLGLSARELAGMAPNDALELVADRLAQVENQSERTAYATALFGRGGVGMVNMLRDGARGLEQLRADARKTGYVLSDEAARDAEVFKDRLLDAQLAVVGMKNTFGAALMPVVTDAMSSLSKFMAENRDQVVRFSRTFAEGIGEALPKLGAFASGLASTLRTVGSALDTVAGLVGGWGNLAAVVGGLVSAKLVVSVVSLGSSLFSLGSALVPLVSMALPSLVVGIKAVGLAFAANPIGLAITGITLAVVRLVTIWDDLKKSFAEGGLLGAVGRFFNFFGDDGPEAAPGGGAAGGGPVPALAGAPSIPELPEAGPGGGVRVAQSVGAVNVYAAPGQSADEVAREVMRRLDERAREAQRGALYD